MNLKPEDFKLDNLLNIKKFLDEYRYPNGYTVVAEGDVISLSMALEAVNIDPRKCSIRKGFKEIFGKDTEVAIICGSTHYDNKFDEKTKKYICISGIIVIAYNKENEEISNDKQLIPLTIKFQ